MGGFGHAKINENDTVVDHKQYIFKRLQQSTEILMARKQMNRCVCERKREKKKVMSQTHLPSHKSQQCNVQRMTNRVVDSDSSRRRRSEAKKG
jgi:hypothetical protein